MHRRTRFLLVIGSLWAVLLGVSLRYEPPHFRPYEMLQVQDTFRPNQRVVHNTSGDLAHVNWLPERRVVHETVFTTDRYGSRNPREILDPRIVVSGDSYVVGAGLSDDETLSEQLAVLLGQPVYNYGCAGGNASGPIAYGRDERFVARPPEVFIYAPVFRELRPLGAPGPRSSKQELTLEERLQELRDQVEQGNGLRRACRRGWYRLTHALSEPPPTICVDGRDALVIPLSHQRLLVTSQRDLERTASTLILFKTYLEGRGTRFIYAPIPESGTIYEDAFPPEQRAQIARPSFVDRLFERLEGQVEVVDLRPAFRANRKPYLYRLDDSHWLPRGVGVAARAIAEALRRE